MKKKKRTSLHRAAQTLGERGGKTGGPARAKSLTKSQREKIAAKGGRAKAAKQDN